MKKLHLLLLLIVCVCLTVSMASCKANPNADPKTNTQQQSGASNANNTNTDGPDIAIGKGMEWPAELMGNLPRLKGKVTAVIKDDQTRQCMVALSDCSQEDAAAYIAGLKKLGYGNGMDMSDTNGYLYSGTNAEKTNVSFAYQIATKEASVTYIPNLSGSLKITEDMTDKAQWPNNFIKGVPELNGKITDVANSNNMNITVYIDYVTKADFEAYIKQLKQNGYTVEADESSSVDSISYKAYNTSREWVNVNLAMREDNNHATVEMEKPSESD